MARELEYSLATVEAATRLSPSLVRLELRTDDWQSADSPDEAMLLTVPGEDGTLVLPPDVRSDDERWDRARWYTVRRHAPGAMTVDVVVHDVGVATRWACEVEPGARVGVSTTHSWFSRPAEATWQVLVGDVVALPAIGRIIEEAPAHVRTIAHVEVAGPADEQTELGDAVTWHHHADLGHSTRVGEIVQGLELPAGPGYVYVAGEAAATRVARKHLRHTLGLGRGTYAVVGYWRIEREAWTRCFEASGIDLTEVYDRGEREGLDEEQLSDEVDRRLEAAGL